MDAPKSFEFHIQRYLLTGLLTLLPIWLTWIVFRFVFELLSGISKPGINAIAHRLSSTFPEALAWLDNAMLQSIIAMTATLLLIYVVGWAASKVIGQQLIARVESLIARIPLAQTIYGGMKKLLDVVQTKPDGSQRVVLINFPSRDMRAVGLVTRIFKDELSGKEYAAVFVPTTPNPTSGYLEIVALENVVPTDWTMDQAMAFIISGGAIAPEKIRIDPPPRGDA